jgi:PAS domain S-box-containing protein
MPRQLWRLLKEIWTSDRQIAGRYLLIFVALMSPVVVVSAFNAFRFYREQTESVLLHKETASRLGAVIVGQKLNALVNLGVSFASRLGLIQGIQEGKWVDAAGRLEWGLENFPEIDRIFLFDKDAVIRSTVPHLPEYIGQSRADKDWYAGVRREWKPYVSKVYQRGSKPKIHCVGIAVPVKDGPDGKVLGVLLLQIRLETFYAWAKSYVSEPGEFAFVVDPAGHLVFHPKFDVQKEIVDFSAVPVVRELLLGRSGVRVTYNPVEQQKGVAAYTAIPEYGWGVVVAQPERFAFAKRNRDFAILILIYAGALSVAGLLCFAAVVVFYQRKKETENLKIIVDAKDRIEQMMVLEDIRQRALLDLGHMKEISSREVSKHAIETAIRLTASKIGYVAFANEDETALVMQYWSDSAMAECAIADKPIVFRTQDTGLWGEAVRQRKPVITNDYAAENPAKKGTPPGHVKVIRHMNIPVFEGDRIVAIAGVGNKDTDYDSRDVVQLQLMMDGMWAIVRRKKIEESLRESEEKFKQISASAMDAVIMMDDEGLVCYWNASAERIFGYPPGEILGRGLHEILAPEIYHGQAARGIEGFRHTGQGAAVGKTLELTAVRKNGLKFPMELSLSSVKLGSRWHAIGILRDISVRKKTEAGLKLASDIQLLLNDLLRLALKDVDFDRFLEESLERILSAAWLFVEAKGAIFLVGDDPSVLVMKAQKGLAAPVLESCARVPFGKCVCGQAALKKTGCSSAKIDEQHTVTYEGMQDHGHYCLPLLFGRKVIGVLCTYVYGGPLSPENEMVLRAVADTLTLAIVQKSSSAAQRESEQRFRDMVETTTDYVWEVDANGYFTYVSPMVTDILGYAVSEVLGKRVDEFSPPEERENLWKQCEALLSARIPFASFECVSLKKNGGKALLECRGIPFWGLREEFRGFRGVNRDITRQRQQETELRQTQKFEAMSTLAGGIAHDFNNILCIITANLYLCEKSVPAGDPVAEKLLEIKTACERAKNLTQQILMYVRKSEKKYEPIDVKTVMVETLQFLRATVPSTIEIRKNLADRCGKVMGDAVEIQQILMNLGMNAMHAIGERMGAIEFGLDSEEVPVRLQETSPPIGPGRFLVLTIRDNGCGMNEATKSRLFELYFTTREVGSGTGMGLAIVQSILRGMDGAVRVESRPGEGTTFRIYLPELENKTRETGGADNVQP